MQQTQDTVSNMMVLADGLEEEEDVKDIRLLESQELS